jgi:mannitol/fructose-specific phosphotransferase system IIA component (Ntr-type)
MDASDIIAADRILCDMKVRSKRHALQIISALLAEGPTRLTAPEILASLCSPRSSRSNTGAANGVVVRHGRDKQLIQPIAAMIILVSPVDFGTEGNDADIVFAIMADSDEDAATLNSVNEMLSGTATPNLLRRAGSAQSALDIMSARLGICV